MTERISVRNPRTGKYDYEIAVTSEGSVATLAANLRAAQRQWQERGLRSRIEVLQSFGAALEDNSAAIVAALSADTGRLAIARQELAGLRSSIERWCRDSPTFLDDMELASTTMPHLGIRQRYQPYALIGAISPWNFPLLLAFIDVIPALLAGCAAIVKPSEITPRFIAPVVDAISAVADLASVLQFVSGDARTGAALIDQVDLVAFTGSVATGRKVARAAAAAFRPAFLELGGKDPAVILDGSDLDRASTAVLRASVAATGQACQSLERIYVNRRQHEEFVALLTKKAAGIDLSYPDPQCGIVGPLILARQAEIIDAHLTDAKARGAVATTGDKIEELGGGLWIRPTVLVDVDHSMRIMKEETFGPIMPVMAFDTEEQAIELANDSDYGLSAAVFGPGEEPALRVASRIRCGGISINDAGLTAMIFEGQKNAFGCSGLGPSRIGPSGFLRFLRQQVLYINRGEVVPLEALAEHPAESLA